MLRLATVFSGIGAIEHTLKRMGIEHEIVFASDNGDVDIFKKKIDINFVDIRNELDRLKKIIDNIDIEIDNDYEYLTDLESHLIRISERINFLQEQNRNYNFDVLSIIDKVDSEKVKKEVQTIISKYTDVNDINNIDKALIISKIEKENKELVSEVILKNDINTKVVIKELKEIVAQLGMLDEKIETLHIHSELRKIKNYSDKKRYVDNLYKERKIKFC